MRVSTYTRNAVNSIIDLALHRGRLVRLSSIAARQHLSVPYLEQIFAKLRRAGLITGVRGPGGGYRLIRDLPDISVADIMLAMGDKVSITGCSDRKNCRGGDMCLSHELWSHLHGRILNYLTGITLEHLVERASGGAVELPDMEPHFANPIAILSSSKSEKPAV